MTVDYPAFLASKAVAAPLRGLPSVPSLAGHLFPFQFACVDFLLRAGSGGLFLDTGLGKTACELEWAALAAEATNGRALIMTPLAVARQIEREGKRWGYPIRVIREQCEAGEGINVCNYDRLEKLSPDAYGAVVLDESGILKSFMGKTSRAMVDAFSRHRFRLSASATPAPNDHTEIAQHSAFLGVMARDEMLVRWFINDSGDTQSWRLKRHGVDAFFDWMASWSRMAEHPRDLGDDVPGFDLLPLGVFRHRVEASVALLPGEMFRAQEVSATDMHRVKRQTAETRAGKIAELVLSDREPWIVWCDTDYEADAVLASLGRDGTREVRGSMPVEKKEDAIAAFLDGTARIMVSKPSILGYGLNLQHCARMAFVGRSFSYESWYQAVRRCWRFGQARPVEVHLIVAEGEDAIGRVIDRKAGDHVHMKASMVAAMQRAMGREAAIRVPYNPRHDGAAPLGETMDKIRCLADAHGRKFSAYHGDCVDVVRQLPSESVDLTVYSPPFSNLFLYSDSVADMGNSGSDDEFLKHYGFLLAELYRVTIPGRLSAVHCSDVPLQKWKDGVIGIKDLSGSIIRAHEAAGWVLHSRITIWKSPVVEMTRTKALGLLYMQLQKDSARSRTGMADYLLVFRKAGDNPKPIAQKPENFPLDQWQEWASPVWMTVNQTRVLNTSAAREPKDERHLCPLQLDVIERALTLWSNPGDTVLSPFMGIGSEGDATLRLGRRFIGVELKESYFKQAIRNLMAIDGQDSLSFGAVMDDSLTI